MSQFVILRPRWMSGTAEKGCCRGLYDQAGLDAIEAMFTRSEGLVHARRGPKLRVGGWDPPNRPECGRCRGAAPILRLLGRVFRLPLGALTSHYLLQEGAELSFESVLRHRLVPPQRQEQRRPTRVSRVCEYKSVVVGILAWLTGYHADSGGISAHL